MQVFGYCRVSTTEQADDGVSLAAQKQQIAGYAMMKGWKLAEVFIEAGVSGSVPLSERPEGRRLLQAVSKGAVVITAKLDRMFRSAADALVTLEELKSQGVALHMIDLGGDVTGNGISKLVFTILSAVAEAERDRTRERITDVKRDQKQRGRYLGGRTPFGFSVGDDGELVPIPAQQAAIARMRSLRAGGMGLMAIAEALRADGVQISHMGVKSVLRG